jgi:hypothetical protein
MCVCAASKWVGAGTGMYVFVVLKCAGAGAAICVRAVLGRALAGGVCGWVGGRWVWGWWKLHVLPFLQPLGDM